MIQTRLSAVLPRNHFRVLGSSRIITAFQPHFFRRRHVLRSFSQSPLPTIARPINYGAAAVTASVAAVGSTVATCVILWWFSVVLPTMTTTTQLLFDSNKKSSKEDDNSIHKINQIEVDFMEKLSRKPYLRFLDDHGKMMDEDDVSHPAASGVPATLRLLTVDLPQVAQAGLGGDCQIATNYVFPDGIAPSQTIEWERNDDGRVDSEHDEIKNRSKTKIINKQRLEKNKIRATAEQKAWVTSMVECRNPHAANKVGIQVMQASVSRLNPHHLLRQPSYRRRLGSSATIPQSSNVTNDNSEKNKTESSKQKANHPGGLVADTTNTAVTSGTTVDLDQEVDAPWNQLAWKSELELRLAGQVGFGETLQATRPWKRRLWGDVYQATTTTADTTFVGALLRPFLFWKWKASPWSSSSLIAAQEAAKPHAVIANGAALQLVPHSLRLLQRSCREHNIPLFVINDPRAWGGNTHSDLNAVLPSLRRAVKRQIVARALEQQSGTAFSHGRTLGRWEVETKWQTKELLRQNKEALQRAASVERRDWSKLSADQLEKELMRRNVITQKQQHDAQQQQSTTAATTPRLYSRAMIALAKKCVDDIASPTVSGTTEPVSPHVIPEHPAQKST